MSELITAAEKVVLVEVVACSLLTALLSEVKGRVNTPGTGIAPNRLEHPPSCIFVVLIMLFC